MVKGGTPPSPRFSQSIGVPGRGDCSVVAAATSRGGG
jgi:hypothetical protein